MQANLRRELRSAVDGVYSICWQSDDGVTHSVEAQGRNLCPSGIGVRCVDGQAPGTIVFIQGPNGSPTGYCIVRHCTPQGGLNHLGLEFGDEARKSVHIAADEAPDYYEFLQISPKAEVATIQRIYRFMAARFHPDNPETGNPDAFLLLNRIYEVLSNPQRRAEYDASRQEREAAPNPMYQVSAFVNGIEGEVNRRLAILALLYNKRRTNPQDPSVSLWDLERKMAIPREYLDFATWYLRSKNYIAVADNSDFTLTALGVDYVEANAGKNPMLTRLLSAGTRTATDFATGRVKDGCRSTEALYRLGPGGKTQPDNLVVESEQNGAGSFAPEP